MGSGWSSELINSMKDGIFVGRIRKIRHCDDGESCGAGEWPLAKAIFQWPQLLGAEGPPAIPSLILSLASLGLGMTGQLRSLPPWKHITLGFRQPEITWKGKFSTWTYLNNKKANILPLF